MIDIKKDKKSDCFIITQTVRIEGIDFHNQMNLRPEELDKLAGWFAQNYTHADSSEDLEWVMIRMRQKAKSSSVYTVFNGVLLSDKDGIQDYLRKLSKTKEQK